MRLLKETKGFRGDLWKLVNYAPEVIYAFYYFKRSKDPEKALKKVINTVTRNPGLEELLKVKKTYEMILRTEKNAEKINWVYACQEALKETGVNYEIIGKENIPEKGALYISNHPYGLIDAIMLIGGLGSLINKKGRGLKVITMNQLKFVKGLEEAVYFVDSIRKSLRYLDEGGDLALYPSGGMSKANLEEYPWKNGLEKFISRSSSVVPMWFSGPDHAKIYNFFAKSKREELKNIFSLDGIWNKEGETVILNIGKPISSKKLKEIEDPEERVQHLRDIAENLKVAV